MSDPAPAARATREIPRSPAVVRAQFRDVDHAIRDRIHHGVELAYLPVKIAGEARVQQTIRVMGRALVEVYVLEEEAGGAWVKRFVEGPNTGARFVCRFEPAGGEAATRVTIEAHVGRAGYQGIFGKLSQLGVEKILQKLLEEHDRALVGYEPGKARGRVRAAIESLRDRVVLSSARAHGESRALMTNLLEAACVVAVADGQADDPERDVIQEVAAQLCFIDLPRDAVDRMVDNVAKAIREDGIEARCDKVAARLASLSLGEVGIEVAVLVAQVSHGLDLPEQAVLSRIGLGLSIDEAALAKVVARVDEALSATP